MNTIQEAIQKAVEKIDNLPPEMRAILDRWEEENRRQQEVDERLRDSY